MTQVPHRIFVVDDEEMIRDSIVEFLDENGYQAVGAADGQEALDKLNAPGLTPCLILLDLMMPNMDGRSFREQQLLSPALAGIPVLVFSAYRDVAKTASELKVAGHLSKPVKLTDLLRAVQRYCPDGTAPLPA